MARNGSIQTLYDVKGGVVAGVSLFEIPMPDDERFYVLVSRETLATFAITERLHRNHEFQTMNST